MVFRKKAPERVLSEIKQLSENHRCLTFSATDNILATEYFGQLLPRIAEMDADFSLFYEVKANLSREQLKTLRAAGIKEIQPGIESFNSRLLRLMRKGVTATQNIQLLKWCYEIEIQPLYNILFGFPGETPADYMELPQIFRILSHLHPPSNIQQVLFERFSPYHFDRENFGLTLSPLPLYRFIFPESRVDLHKIAYYFDGSWKGQQVDPLEYIRPTLEAWAPWKKHWEHQDIFCYYDKGPNFLVIHDNRPTKIAGFTGERRILLEEPVAAIYLFCNENRSLQAIQAMMAEKFAGRIGKNSVLLWLDQLVSQDLLFRENDRYLALAVRRKPARIVHASIPQSKEAAGGQ